MILHNHPLVLNLLKQQRKISFCITNTSFFRMRVSCRYVCKHCGTRRDGLHYSILMLRCMVFECGECHSPNALSWYDTRLVMIIPLFFTKKIGDTSFYWHLVKAQVRSTHSQPCILAAGFFYWLTILHQLRQGQ